MSIEVTFINRTAAALTYLWHFGDGSTSTAPSPKHTYVSAGAYVVTLEATGAGGVGTTQKVVVVAGGSIAEFFSTSDLDIMTTSGGDQLTVS